MRLVRVAFVIFTALVFFLLLNSVMGKLFPATKNTADSSTASTSYYSKCSSLQQSGGYATDIDGNSSYTAPDNSAYDKCIEDGQAEYDQSIKSRYDQSGMDQIRNIYVVLVVLLIILALIAVLHRFLPLLSAGMLLGGIYFTLYFPPSNVISSWYDSAFSMSETVRIQLHNTVIIASLIGFIAIILTSILSLEKKPRTQASVEQPPYSGDLG